MDIQLGAEEISRHTLLKGQDVFTLAADEKLVIKKGPAGTLTTIYDDKVPNGKTWTVLVFVQITEAAV